MVLYKYVGFEAGLKILETNTLGFSHLEDFNDPFELSALMGGLGTLNYFHSVMRTGISKKYVILCLTKKPLNSLMWSHYADSYKGMVIGVDVEKAGLGDSEQFIIPYQKGRMVYSNKRSTCIDKFVLDNLLSPYSAKENFDYIKKAFFVKSKDWRYEKEIRVIKDCNNIKEKDVSWSKSECNRFSLFHIPKDAVVEVYVGYRYKKEEWEERFASYEVNSVKGGFDIGLYNEYQSKFDKLKEMCRENNINLYTVNPCLRTKKLYAVKLSE